LTALLFTPYEMRGLTLENRIVLSPMCQYAASEGNASDWHLMHLGQFACANVGLIITEATGVEPRGRISPQCLGLYSDENQAALARVVRFCREYGRSKFGVQLAHAGRKSSTPASFLARKPIPPEEGGWTPLSPSDYEDKSHPRPQVMTLADIAQAQRDFVQAVRRAAAIGVDLIELHFAHGYLINSFLSPLINRREDQYGGSLENRMRFGLEIFEQCRVAFPDERPIGVRISAVDWVEGGWTLEDSCVLARELKARGCDYICCSSGGVTLDQKITPGPGYQTPFAEAVRREGAIATMAVGQIWEPQQAEDVLQAGKADMIALGRKFMSNPHWAWTAATYFQQPLPYPPRYRVAHPRLASGSGEALSEAEKGTRMFHGGLDLTPKSW
jgi:2,4-dienoyl-CoA reductase-like NADH-dependent reductase (Old Yellow Enzyme family)